jgi:NADP-dependent 3-hydroxy acid dehydrogenase YdfG
MGLFNNQTALVTGAGSGIGQAIALALGGEGARLCLVGRRRERLEATAQGLPGCAPQPLPYPADVTCEEEMQQLAEAVRRDVGELHLLVHSAGAIELGSHDSASVSDFDRQYQVNLRAPYRLTQLLLPTLLAAQGQVVFINSTAGVSARAGVGQYCATKHALKAIADCLREEVNPLGVRVLSVFPGRTVSPMQEAVYRMEGAAYDPDRCMQPSDVASVVVNALGLPRTAEVTEIYLRPMRK